MNKITRLIFSYVVSRIILFTLLIIILSSCAFIWFGTVKPLDRVVGRKALDAWREFFLRYLYLRHGQNDIPAQVEGACDRQVVKMKNDGIIAISTVHARRDGRVDEGDGLENHCGCKVTEGSNPSPSAITIGYVSPGEVPEWLIGAAC